MASNPHRISLTLGSAPTLAGQLGFTSTASFSAIGTITSGTSYNSSGPFLSPGIYLCTPIMNAIIPSSTTINITSVSFSITGATMVTVFDNALRKITWGDAPSYGFWSSQLPIVKVTTYGQVILGITVYFSYTTVAMGIESTSTIYYTRIG